MKKLVVYLQILALLMLLPACGAPATEAEPTPNTYAAKLMTTGRDIAQILDIAANSDTLFLLAQEGDSYLMGKSLDASSFEWLQLELPEGYFPVALTLDHDGSLYVSYFSSMEVDFGVYDTSVLISKVNDGLITKEIARLNDYRCPTDMKFGNDGQLYLAIGNSPVDAITSTRTDYVLRIGDIIQELSGSGMDQIIEEVFALQDDTINWQSMGWSEAPRALLTFNKRLFALSADGQLYELEESTEPRQIITLGIVSGLTDGSVERFNATNIDYTVEIVYYESVEALGLAMATGNAPDLLDLRQIPVSAYINKGILEDLTPWFEASDLNEADYFASVIELTRNQGKCYSVVTSFSLGGIAADNSLTQGLSSWSFDEMQQITDGNIEFSRPLQDLFCFDNESYFTTERITAILEFAKALRQQETSDDGAAFDCIISGVDDVAWNRMMYQHTWPEGVNYLGYPSDDGTGLALKADLGIELAMVATSNNKAGAWEYIKYTLSEENQGLSYFFPVRIASYDKICSELLNEDGSQVTEEDIKACKELIESADIIVREDSSVLSIIEEEAAAYFAGDKTAEETAKIIQNRVQTYLSEQG